MKELLKATDEWYNEELEQSVWSLGNTFRIIIVKLGYTSMLDYYYSESLYENERTALVQNRMPDGVRGQLINKWLASCSILKIQIPLFFCKFLLGIQKILYVERCTVWQCILV